MKIWNLYNGYKIDQVLSGRSNSYLISTDNGNILVDTGRKNKRTLLIKNLQRLQIEKIDWLILTHAHFDHCENAGYFQKNYNCRVVVSEKGLSNVKRGYSTLPRGTNPISKIISGLGNQFLLRLFHFESFDLDHTYDEFFSFSLPGIDIELIATPGHSDDSISIIVNNEMALVGDAMFGIFKNSIFPPFADNPAEMVESWDRLLDTDCHTFLPGHGSEIKRELVEREQVKYSSK
jgi:glyoxylase-like metal-dependent hydrolase (beta-lactamase superfamily II)